MECIVNVATLELLQIIWRRMVDALPIVWSAVQSVDAQTFNKCPVFMDPERAKSLLAAGHSFQ